MDAPETNTTASPGSPAIETPTPMKPARKAKAQRKPQPQAAAVEEDEEEDEERPIATGAVARVRRRRKQWNQRNDQVSSAGVCLDGGYTLGIRCRDTGTTS